MKRLILGLFTMGLMSACSIEANVSELFPVPDLSNLLSQTQGGEFVSGSTQYETTVNQGYRVQVSVGSYIKELKSVTPSQYTVFTSIQGDILSDQVAQ